MGLSVMIVHDALISVKKVTGDIIKRCHVEELTQYDVSMCAYGVYVLK